MLQTNEIVDLRYLVVAHHHVIVALREEAPQKLQGLKEHLLLQQNVYLRVDEQHPLKVRKARHTGKELK